MPKNLNLFKFLSTGLIVGITITVAQAQNPIKTHNHQDLIWLGYFSRIDFNERLAFTGDYQFRRKDWFAGWSQKVFRQGITYAAHKNLELTAGFAYLQHHKNDLIQNEHRPYQQILIFNDFAGIKLDHRYRFEQRFIQKIENNHLLNDYFFNYRVRYKVALAVPIKINRKGTAWSVYVDNELMINFGEDIFINMFDQNRFSAGMNYKVSDNIKLQLGYMRLFAQKATVGAFENANIIRFNVYHRVSFLRE